MTFYLHVIYHFGGSFKADNTGFLRYLNGSVKRLPRMDIDLVNYFDLVKLFKDKEGDIFNCERMFWMYPGMSDFGVGLRLIKGDKEINELCDAAIEKGSSTNKCDIHIYFDHPILGTRAKHQGKRVIHARKEVQSGSSSESDDYDSAEDSAYKPPPANNDDDSDETNEVAEFFAKRKGVGKRSMKKKKGAGKKRKSDSSTESESCENSFEVGGYLSYSEKMRTPESTDDEASSRMNFPVFKECTQFGQVRLTPGLEFDNLDLFKTAVKDYNINLGIVGNKCT